ncbi:hypothetical protein [Shewanella gelidii]|nr:hypothetical protein [Shewanella gelidii]MCL1097663.1 hypothetical protein [Shewanella gelidii]
MDNLKIVLLCLVAFVIGGCESRPKMSYQEKMRALERMTGQSQQEIEASIASGERKKKLQRQQRQERQLAQQQAQEAERKRMQAEVEYRVLQAREATIVLPDASVQKPIDKDQSKGGCTNQAALDEAIKNGTLSKQAVCGE